MDSRQIEERAAAWLAKRDSGEWSDEDERQLQEWLDASTANTVAFIRLESVWSDARRLKALGAGMEPGVVPPPNAWRLSPFVKQSNASQPTRQRKPKRLLFGALAASLALVVAGSLVWQSMRSAPDYRTPIGGLASVPMKDGSKVTLNTDSAIRVDVTETERRVQLERGEAFFEVAKDPARPFIVSAGSKRVVAVGTKFSVRRIGDDVRVFVTEGKVRVEDERAPEPDRVAVSAATSQPESGATLLTAGAIARAGDSGILVQQKTLPEIEDNLGWLSGFVIFRDVPLADAVAEFNRYNERKIVIRDSQVAAIPVSGKFRSTNFEGFVRLLEEGFAIHARREEGRIVLTATEP